MIEYFAKEFENEQMRNDELSSEISKHNTSFKMEGSHSIRGSIVTL